QGGEPERGVLGGGLDGGGRRGAAGGQTRTEGRGREPLTNRHSTPPPGQDGSERRLWVVRADRAGGRGEGRPVRDVPKLYLSAAAKTTISLPVLITSIAGPPGERRGVSPTCFSHRVLHLPRASLTHVGLTARRSPFT